MLREPCPYRVVERRAHGSGVAIVSAQHHAVAASRGAPLGRFGQQALPDRLIMTPPAEETEVVAQQSGRDVARDQRGLDRQTARAAHRIDEPELAVIGGHDLRPARTQQHRRGQILLEGRRTLRAAIAATMQAVAREIDGQRRDVAVEVQVQAYVGCGDVDRRPRA